MMSRASRSVLRASCLAFCVAMALPVLAATYYVDAEKGDDGYDGTSPTVDGGNVGPRKTLAGGFELLANKDTLSIAGGEYKIDAQIECTKTGITIEGDPSDRSKVVVNGQATCRAFKLATPFFMSNLTVSNCLNTADCAGGALWIAYGGAGGTVVSNCVFACNTNNSTVSTAIHKYGSTTTSLSTGTGGAVLQDCNGAVRFGDCDFIANWANGNGGAICNMGDTGTWLEMSNCTFVANRAGSQGGAGFSERNRTARLLGCNVISNTATSHGGGWSKQCSLFTNCVFRGNVSGGEGGAYYGGDGSSAMNIRNCWFYGNRAVNGGGVRPTTNEKTIRDCWFEGNTATSQGGALYMAGSINSVGHLTNCTFKSNSSVSGGAISGIVGKMSDCVFEDNVATDCGAAWYWRSNNGWSEVAASRKASDGKTYYADFYPWMVTNCVFRRNGTRRTSCATGSAGGTISVRDLCRKLNFVGCEFTDNSYDCGLGTNGVTSAATVGGVIQASQMGRIVGCGFTNNWAIGAHGAAFAGVATNGIRHCSFVGNSSAASTGSDERDAAGGAIFFMNHVAAAQISALKDSEGNYLWNTVEDCEFIGNSVVGRAGGAIACSYRGLRLNRCSFDGNSVTNAGKAYGNTFGGAVIVNGSGALTKNNASLSLVDNALPVEIDNCSFTGNRSTGRGGALWIADAQLNKVGVQRCAGHVRNCLFANNSVSRKYANSGAGSDGGEGAAICVSTQRLEIANCTFTGGRAVKCGAIQNITAAGGEVTVTNCVFYDNLDEQKDSTTFDTCLLAAENMGYNFAKAGGTIATGNGNVISDANPFRADDHTAYAVRKDCGSAAGLKLDWMTPDSLDLGGKPRLAKDGTVDFGCYQFWRKPGLLLFVW